MKQLLVTIMTAIGLSVTALAITTINLSNLDGSAAPGDMSDPDRYVDNSELVVPDGVVLTGELPDGNYKVSIATNATVVLSNVSIDQATLRGECAGISCRGSATIKLEGKNTVIGGYGYPGIFVPVSDPANTKIVPGPGLQTPKQGDATLTIKTRELCCGLTTPGTLKAKGNDFGAGIGCGNYTDNWGVDTKECGHIVIESGIITAWGGTDTLYGNSGGAGIGSVGSGYHGDIIIKGGTVEAEGGCDAPGIGGGCLPDEVTGEVTGYKGRIIILGGEVEAIGGGEHGPGIGSGIGCALGDILISGGSVTAEGGLWVPGIGVPSSVPDATCGNITIAPGVASVVVVTGYDAKERDDIIGSRDDDTSTVCGQITLPEPADGYDITTDYVTDTCTIRPSAWDGNLTGLTRNVVATDGMTITGTLSGDRKVSIVDGATVTLDNVRIAGSSSATSPHAGITCLGDANIILEGNNYVRPFGTGPAAIAYYKRTVNMGNNQYIPASYSFAYVLDISGDGTLNVGGTLPGPQPMGARLLDANISYGGAGLGAGVDEDCGDLVINGGTISATGGNGAAGIGGAHGASSGSIEILGGTVNATGGDGAAGIGSGDDSGCGDITISGATVTATAGANATPIGAGAGGGPVNVTLDGVSDTTSGSTRIIVPYEDLGALTDDLLLTDGMTIYGTLSGNYKVSIADGATVTLSNVVIDCTNNSEESWAGITCEGDATIILKGENTVKGFHKWYPGIYVPVNYTLTIEGYTHDDGTVEGKLTAYTGYTPEGTFGSAAGIGAGYQPSLSCGNIVIEGGTIEAQGGYGAAGIGGGSYGGTCGNITIHGGSISAKSASVGAGIGSGRTEGSANAETCGTITIDGGTVEAYGGSGGSGIGNGFSGNSRCAGVVIKGGITSVYAVSGDGSTDPVSATYISVENGLVNTPGTSGTKNTRLIQPAAVAAYSTWATDNGVTGTWDAVDANGIANVFRYAFDVPQGEIDDPPLLDITFNAQGKPVIKTPELVKSTGFTFSIVASDNVDGTGNRVTYVLNQSGETVVDEQASGKRFFRLKVELGQ